MEAIEYLRNTLRTAYLKKNPTIEDAERFARVINYYLEFTGDVDYVNVLMRE